MNKEAIENFEIFNLNEIDDANPIKVRNFVRGMWLSNLPWREIPNPLNGKRMLLVPDTKVGETYSFQLGLESTPSFGLHNPKWNTFRYDMLADVCGKTADMLADSRIADYFTNLIALVVAKSYDQSKGEVDVVRTWLNNYRGNRVRFLAQGMTTPGSKENKMHSEFPWPYGPVMIITPFNFPLEIPALQTLSALFMGNRPLVKVDSKVSIVFAEFLRLLHYCGLPTSDVDLLHCRGEEMGKFVMKVKDVVKIIQFTGSSEVAGWLRKFVVTKEESGGFDWKILGPDYQSKYFQSVALQSHKDAYNFSGQKCSAQSALFVHMNWINRRFVAKIKEHASKCNLQDKTLGPLLSVTTDKFLEHIKALLEIPGAQVLFGGKALREHSIPSCYGAVEPTAVFVPLYQIRHHLALVCKEIFGPFQIVSYYSNDEDAEELLNILEKISQRLTAGIVSNDMIFAEKLLGRTTNGTTYVGMGARTTGMLTAGRFGPCGAGAGSIHTDRAIIETWSCPRQITYILES